MRNLPNQLSIFYFCKIIKCKLTKNKFCFKKVFRLKLSQINKINEIYQVENQIL